MGKKSGNKTKSAEIDNNISIILGITYIFWSRCLPVSMCMKSGTYFLITFTISNFPDFELLKTVSKLASTSSNDILISGVLINPSESYFFIL